MKYPITDKYVKKIGRTAYINDILWCGLSGSGIAFQVTGTKVSLTLIGDDSTAGNTTEGQARVSVYVNDSRVIDTMMDAPEKTLCVWESKLPETVTIQVIKLSECPMSSFGIKEIDAVTTDADISPLPLKAHSIEFIGDSITCGYGVDREDEETHFETATEDVTRAYAYKTAKALDVDYSMCSYSGYGIISGYTDNGQKLDKQLVPTYYEKVGFSYGKPFGTVVLSDILWDFSKFQPELVVVNLGTNDDSYCQDEVSRQNDFIEHYIEFLKTVRAKNPAAQILCTIGTMCQRIADPIKTAVQSYIDQTADKGISFYKLPLQLPEDGLVSDYHPTEVSHTKAANLLTTEIKRIMNW